MPFGRTFTFLGLLTFVSISAIYNSEPSLESKYPYMTEEERIFMSRPENYLVRFHTEGLLKHGTLTPEEMHTQWPEPRNQDENNLIVENDDF
jgi:hypothetical protein